MEKFGRRQFLASVPLMAGLNSPAASADLPISEGYRAQPASTVPGLEMPTIAALRAYPVESLTSGTMAQIQGYYSTLDCCGGAFLWSESSALEDDGGRVINPAGHFDVGRWIRLSEGAPLTPMHFGAKGDGVTDDTVALQNFFRIGGALPVPHGGFYKVTHTIQVPSNVTVRGAGDAAIIRMVLPSGSPVVPLMTTARGSSYVNLEGFQLDHNAAKLSDPAVRGGNPVAGTCLLVMSSYSRISNIVVANAWDNGVNIADVDLVTFEGVPGTPRSVLVDDIRTTNCGCGIHTISALPGLIGAGVVCASGSAVVISNCVDVASYSGFATDTGGGAQATFVNCTSWNAKMDPKHPGNGSGNAFVSQSGQGRFIGCFAFWSGAYGFWIAGGDSCQLSGCQSDGAGYHGFYINQSNTVLTGCQSQNSSQNGTGRYDGFCIGTTFDNIRGVVLTGCVATDNSGKQRSGYNEIQTSHFLIEGCMVEGVFAGGARTCGRTNIWTPAPHGSFQVDPASGEIALGGYRNNPVLRIQPAARSNQQWVEIHGGENNSGASLHFNGYSDGQSGSIIIHQKAGLNFCTRGDTVQLQINDSAGTSFPSVNGGVARAYLGVSGSDAHAQLSVSGKGNGAVLLSKSGPEAGPVISRGAQIDGSGVRVALTSNIYTVPENTSLVRFTQSDAISSTTVELPQALSDGQPIQFVNYAGAIGALHFTPSVNGWRRGASLNAFTGIRIRWDADAGAWFREQ